MRHRVFRWTAALVAIVMAVSIAPPATAADDGIPVVFIVDASGSMVRDTSPGVSRMDVAKQATIDTLESLPAGSDVGMLVFGTGTGNEESERAAGCADVKTIAPLGPLDLTEITDGVQAIAPSGFTPIGPALRAAVGMLPAGEAGNIVLISDGVDTCAPPASCEVAAQVHRENPLVSIHVVAFAVDEDEAAQQQMSCIGGVGGGTSVTASNATQLTSRLRAAADSSGSSLGIHGVHGVEIGMTLAEVRARVDGAKVGQASVVDGVEVVYVDCGWGTVELRNNRVWSISPKADVGTAEGIAPGATLGDVEALYGAPVDSGTTTDGLSNVYQTTTGSPIGYRVFYDQKTKKVTRIVLCRCVPASALSAGVAAWEITFDGIGPIELGMTLDHATAAVPALASYESQGLIELTFIEDALAKITVNDRGDENLAGSTLPHARGIRIGDTGATARNAFPGGSYFVVQVAPDSRYEVSNREGRVISFEVIRLLGGGTFEQQIDRSAISRIAVEDAAVLRTDAAREYLYNQW